MIYLITGGAGFIGSNYVNHLLAENRQVIILDSLTYAGNLENISSHLNYENILIPTTHRRLSPISIEDESPQTIRVEYDSSTEKNRLAFKTKGFHSRAVNVESIADSVQTLLQQHSLIFVYGSIVDSDLVSALMPLCDIVVNFAAETHVDRSILNPDEFIRTDVYGTYVLLEAARKCENLKKFVHISTDEVYGVATGHSFTESDPINPRNPYSASKAAADRLVYAYNQTYNLPVTIVRPSNNFGPYQYPEKLIPVMIIKALRDEPLPVYGDGRQIRDWLYVNDTVRALDCIVSEGGIGEVYNIAGGNERENIEVVRFILQTLNKPETLIQHIKDRPGHDRRYSLDDTKLCEELGFRHSGSFEENLKSTIQWYLDNREWWQRIIESDSDYTEFIQAWYGSTVNAGK
ncbi:MAG: dTDP-glucose 4,6-dehydratase [Methanomicrobiales archaeon 53_19]|uniref:dTDP-glucose 4,6-dehydratase n=1 Tax=Methanocalculus sp. TaxID=2004547 RepID=UPI000747DB35|nr:dTDP-glucose 4,6-dehydratase [Methanocalculus sp.]KUL02522.1 MAG: dTDP-glucose 4,6-dehydratase [Methanomicrobiales archaeon 53_19]